MFPRINLPTFRLTRLLKKRLSPRDKVTPTPIQDGPFRTSQGRRPYGTSQCTGQKGAFLIPLINKVRLDRKQQVLIIAPTRELAIQIDSELKGFTRRHENIFGVRGGRYEHRPKASGIALSI